MEAHKEVKDFLESIKLDKYLDKLLENGIDDLQTILHLKDDHISQMGFPLGHKLKMIKRIRILNEEIHKA